MKIKIATSAVEVEIDGLDYTRRQLTELLGEVAGIAIAIEDAAPAPIEQERSFCFRLGADTQLAEIAEPDLSEYFEDEE